MSAKGSGSWPPVRRRRAARLVRAGVCCGARRGGGGQEAAGPSNARGQLLGADPAPCRAERRASKQCIVGTTSSALRADHDCGKQPAGMHQGFRLPPAPTTRLMASQVLSRTCTSFTGRPGNRCCAAARASVSSAVYSFGQGGSRWSAVAHCGSRLLSLCSRSC